MKTLRNILIVVGVVIVVLVIFMSRCPRGDQGTWIEEVEVPVRVEFPESRYIVKEVGFTGVLQGEDETYVYSDIPGQFQAYEVEEGQTVEKDQVVAYLERDVPGLEYKPYAVESPISGRVSLMAIERGQMVDTRTPIARVANVENLKAVFSVPDKYLGTLEKGKGVTVKPSDGRQVHARISWFSSFLDPVSKTARVHAKLDNGRGDLVPGMFVDALLVVEEKTDALSIPYDAVLGEVSRYVFVVEEGKAQRIDVEVGISDDRFTEIRSGLSEGDSVVVVGQSNLRQGIPVLVKPGE
jgi:multidrug efflux pump subunit AcrA (membrane-fusion protein)